MHLNHIRHAHSAVRQLRDRTCRNEPPKQQRHDTVLSGHTCCSRLRVAGVGRLRLLLGRVLVLRLGLLRPLPVRMLLLLHWRRVLLRLLLLWRVRLLLWRGVRLLLLLRLRVLLVPRLLRLLLLWLPVPLLLLLLLPVLRVLLRLLRLAVPLRPTHPDPVRRRRHVRPRLPVLLVVRPLLVLLVLLRLLPRHLHLDARPQRPLQRRRVQHDHRGLVAPAPRHATATWHRHHAVRALHQDGGRGPVPLVVMEVAAARSPVAVVAGAAPRPVVPLGAGAVAPTHGADGVFVGAGVRLEAVGWGHVGF